MNYFHTAFCIRIASCIQLSVCEPRQGWRSGHNSYSKKRKLPQHENQVKRPLPLTVAIRCAISSWTTLTFYLRKQKLAIPYSIPKSLLFPSILGIVLLDLCSTLNNANKPAAQEQFWNTPRNPDGSYCSNTISWASTSQVLLKNTKWYFFMEPSKIFSLSYGFLLMDFKSFLTSKRFGIY